MIPFDVVRVASRMRQRQFIPRDFLLSAEASTDGLAAHVGKDLLGLISKMHPGLHPESRDIVIETCEHHKSDGEWTTDPTTLMVEARWWPKSTLVLPRYGDEDYGAVLHVDPSRIKVPWEPIRLYIQRRLTRGAGALEWGADTSTTGGPEIGRSVMLECVGWDPHERCWVYGAEPERAEPRCGVA